MKTTHNAQNGLKKSSTYAPKIGGIEYWIFIAARALVVFFAIGVGVFFTLGWFLKYNALWIGAAVALFVTLKFVAHQHRRFTQMSDKEYRLYFLKLFSRSRYNSFAQNTCQNPHERIIQFPYDMTNPLYWTIGAGSSHHQEMNKWD